MKYSKIVMTPEMQAFNDELEACDVMLDYKHDQESAEAVLHYTRMNGWRFHAKCLESAMINLDLSTKGNP